MTHIFAWFSPSTILRRKRWSRWKKRRNCLRFITQYLFNSIHAPLYWRLIFFVHYSYDYDMCIWTSYWSKRWYWRFKFRYSTRDNLEKEIILNQLPAPENISNGVETDTIESKVNIKEINVYQSRIKVMVKCIWYKQQPTRYN